MNWKKRVVSIILMLTTIITILPAEQVFAGMTGDNQVLCLKDAQWAVHVGAKFGWRYDKGIKADAVSIDDRIDSDSLAPKTVIKDFKNSSVYANATSGKDCQYGYTVLDSLYFEGKALNLELALGFENTYTEIVEDNSKDSAKENGSLYNLSKIIGACEVIYSNRFFYSGQADHKDVPGSTDDNWLYFVATELYYPQDDKFIHLTACYVNDWGDGKQKKFIASYIIDNNIKRMGFAPSWDGCVAKWGKQNGDVKDAIKLFLDIDDRDVRDKNINRMLTALKRIVNYKYVTSKPNAIEDDVIYIRTENNTDDYDVRVLSYYDGAEGREIETLGYYLASSMLIESTKAESSNLLNQYKVVLVDDSVQVTVAEGSRDFILMNTKTGIDKVNTNRFDREHADVADTILISECEMPSDEDVLFGMNASVNIDTSKNVYDELLTWTRNYYSVFIVEGKYTYGKTLGNEDKAALWFHNEQLITEGDEEYYHNAIPGVCTYLYAFKEKVDETHYESDTGKKIVDMLNNLASASGLKITYTETKAPATYLDWRALSGADVLDVTGFDDLINIVAFVKLIYNNESIPTEVREKFSSITIQQGTYSLVLYQNSTDVGALRGWYKDGESCEPELENSMYVETIDTLGDVLLHGAETGLHNSICRALQNANSMYNMQKSGSVFTVGTDDYGRSKSLLDIDITADDTAYLIETINRIDGEFSYTGVPTNSLSYAVEEFFYLYNKKMYGVGEYSLSGVQSYSPFDMFISTPYNRASSLEGSKYAGEDYAGVDYLPRLPNVEYDFSREEQILLYNIDYGLNVLDFSTISDEAGTDATTFKDWLVGGNAVDDITRVFAECNLGDNSSALDFARSGVYSNVPEMYMHLFKIIISLHKYCDLMGSELGMSGEEFAQSWSYAVYKFYSLYGETYGTVEGSEFFEAIATNLTNFTMSEYTYSNAIEPLGFVARFKDEQFSSQWKLGYSITSHYVPFQTNLYEISAIEELIKDTEWVTEFYYKYGFYRKALYVTTDSEAVVDRILTGTQSGTKVATLRDLLNYERDIELYIDQSFYNADELEKQLDKFISNAGADSVFGSIFDAISLTPSIILKTGGYSSYSKEVATNVKPIIGNSDMVEEKEYAYDSFLLSEEDILGKDGFLSAYEYSIQQPYGVVSAVYRTQDIYNAVGKASVKNQPVFVSSKNAVGIQANNYSNYRMFYNYITLSSLQSIIDHETTLLVDLDAPIFMDIFGNIVTADGYVIIPAAANATLAGSAFTPYSIGYATYVHNADELVYSQLTPQFYDWFYGTDYAYITGKSSISNKTSSYRELCQNTGGGYMFLKNDGTTSMGTTTVTDGVASATVVWDNLNTRLAVLKNLLMSVHFINSANFWDDTHINMVIEVLRGAPMEHIDLDKEGLVVDSGMGPFEAYIAYRVEQLQQAIKTDSNGTEKDKGLSFTFSVLDIFHIESAERIALLAVKCLLIGFLLLLAAMIVADASVGKMPLNVVYRIVVTCILTGACISLIPVLADFSLSTTTRSLLQKEASEMLAMRAQKEAQGIEIGVVQTFPVESTTDIVVKVGELDVQWYDLLLFSAYSSIDNSFEDLYVEAEHGIPIANAPYTVRRGKELYIDIGQIMDTTVVQYDATEGVLTNHVAGYVDETELSASYMLPYYVILDQLIANVNMYNAKNGVTPKNYSVNSDGSIRTQDLTYAYFHSNEFLTDTYDMLDMGRWFNVHTPKIMYAPFFTEDDIKSFNLSVWYPTEADQTQLLNSINKLYNKAREYVLENSEMLSYVSDAAYLKSLAMYLAVEYNSIFGVGIADAFEVKCLDTEDLLRYVIGTPDQVYKFANRTYARYAHEVNGGLGSLLAGLLYIVFCLCNIVKVASFLLVYITCIGSIIYHRVFKREDQYALYGFFILIGELTIVNLVYAVLFKVCMNLTRWGVPGILACLLVILFCVGMIFAFLGVGNNGVKNIKNLGRAEVEAINHFFSGLADRMHNRRTAAAPSDGVERTVGVLQAHDFTRQEYDDFEGNRGSVDDLKAHDRRRREGKVKDDSTD